MRNRIGPTLSIAPLLTTMRQGKEEEKEGNGEEQEEEKVENKDV